LAQILKACAFVFLLPFVRHFSWGAGGKAAKKSLFKSVFIPFLRFWIPFFACFFVNNSLF
jgi:hypothetical protein